MRSLLVVVLLTLLPGTASPQPSRVACRGPFGAAEQDEFMACARAGTQRYQDQRAAILDGYRRIGRDFPGMGEHWIRVGLVFDGAFDASRPELLNYITVDGMPHLVGVAYAVPLLADEHPPPSPAGPTAWHEHSRSLADETLLPRHMHGDASTGARLSMLHAWIWSPSPGGMFAADNWALPYLRLQLLPPADLAVPAAKALSLASGSREYFELAIEVGAAPSPEDKTQIGYAMDAAERQAVAIAKELRQPGGDGGVSERLSLVWTQLWAAMERSVSADVRPRLAVLAIR